MKERKGKVKSAPKGVHIQWCTSGEHMLAKEAGFGKEELQSSGVKIQFEWYPNQFK